MLIFSGISDTFPRRTLQNLAKVEEKGESIAVLHPPSITQPILKGSLIIITKRLRKMPGFP